MPPHPGIYVSQRCPKITGSLSNIFIAQNAFPCEDLCHGSYRRRFHCGLETQCLCPLTTAAVKLHKEMRQGSCCEACRLWKWEILIIKSCCTTRSTHLPTRTYTPKPANTLILSDAGKHPDTRSRLSLHLVNHLCFLFLFLRCLLLAQ